LAAAIKAGLQLSEAVMHKAKAFLFVSAGIFLLALAYHLGARSVGAQSTVIDLGEVGQEGSAGPYFAVAVAGRTPYFAQQGTVPGSMSPGQPLPPIPGTSPVLAISATARGDVPVISMMANGDVYEFNSDQGAWYLAGNVLGGPTPATRETWGGVKARYRQPGAAAPRDK
jgi:hypothetical protein